MGAHAASAKHGIAASAVGTIEADLELVGRSDVEPGAKTVEPAQVGARGIEHDAAVATTTPLGGQQTTGLAEANSAQLKRAVTARRHEATSSSIGWIGPSPGATGESSADDDDDGDGDDDDAISIAGDDTVCR